MAEGLGTISSEISYFQPGKTPSLQPQIHMTRSRMTHARSRCERGNGTSCTFITRANGACNSLRLPGRGQRQLHPALRKSICSLLQHPVTACNAWPLRDRRYVTVKSSNQTGKRGPNTVQVRKAIFIQQLHRNSQANPKEQAHERRLGPTIDRQARDEVLG